MIDDPIVKEVREVRERHAAQFNYDLKKIAQDLKRQEQQSGKKVVSLHPKLLLKATGT